MLEDIIEFIKDMLTYIIIIAIIVLLRVYVISSIEEVGDSMEPNFHDGNIMLMDTIGYKHLDFLAIKRFDVVVIEYDIPKYIIKRVIGLPNEKISYVDNKLYINGSLVEEKHKINGITEDIEEIEIPSDMYFVLGDNRENSTDSRTFGLVQKNKIVGKPFLVIWPFKEIKFVN